MRPGLDEDAAPLQHGAATEVDQARVQSRGENDFLHLTWLVDRPRKNVPNGPQFRSREVEGVIVEDAAHGNSRPRYLARLSCW